jgi:hypothetical protein
MFTINTFVEGKPLKVTSAVTLGLFSWVFLLSPNAFAVKEELTKEDKRQAAIERALDKTPEQALYRRLQLLKDRVVVEIPAERERLRKAEGEKLVGQAKQYLESWGLLDSSLMSDEQRERIRTLQQEINARSAENLAGFVATEKALQGKKNLPAVALERHRAAVAQVKQRNAAFQKKMATLLQATDAEGERKALEDLAAFLKRQQFSKNHDFTHLKKLPFGAPANKARKAHEDSVALQRELGIKPVMLASLTTQGLLENTRTPTAADLAESIEIQLTPAIRAKAAELNHNPVEIYTWVHNSVRFIPSYGSIQGADYTLQTLRGNSFDTASLLIALLRASNIPARYAYGAVDIPVAKMMNWVGGVENIQAAINLIGQGGIPHTLMRLNGVDTSIRMEQVWVEAFVDFEPSRGMKQVEGDSWIAMDASFKQYEFTEGMKVQEHVPFDANALVATIESQATINEQEGWVQNLPQADIEAQLTTFQNQVKAYIENQNPEATLGDVLGLQQVKVKTPQPLAAGLPYDLITAKQSFSEIPAHLRHTFSYGLHAAGFNGALGNALFTVKRTLPELAGKKLALSYKPSTPADEAIILSYLPEVPASGELDPNSLPTSLPGYLINMTAEFTIDGAVVATAPAGKMGAEIMDRMDMTAPEGDDFPATTNHLTVGQYHAIGLDLQSLSADQLQQLQGSLETTKAVLEAAQTNPDALNTLTKHALVGDLLQATVQSYFAMLDLQNELIAQTAKAELYRMPSYGKFSTNLQTVYSWGVPRQVHFDGMMMDMDMLITLTGNHTNDKTQQKLLQQQLGMMNSTMEHLIPEQLFSTEESPAHGVSAVKAIQLAAQEGQRIYHIAGSNLETALAAIDLNTSVEREIREAVYAGKEVTTHSHRINFYGKVTAGYIILDPLTGNGVYKIATGEDGSWFDFTEIFDLAFALMGFLTELASYEKKMPKKIKKFYRNIFSKVFGVFGAVSTLIAGGFDIWECIQHAGWGGIILLPLLMAIIALSFVSVVSVVTIWGFLLNTIICNLVQMILQMAMNVFLKDCLASDSR